MKTKKKGHQIWNGKQNNKGDQNIRKWIEKARKEQWTQEKVEKNRRENKKESWKENRKYHGTD